MNDLTLRSISHFSGSYRFALDLYWRFLKRFGTIVLKMDRRKFEDIEERLLQRELIDGNSQISINSLENIVAEFKKIVFRDVSDDPWNQLNLSIKATIESFIENPTDNELAREAILSFNADIIVQVMTYGSRNIMSGCGVVYRFTT